MKTETLQVFANRIARQYGAWRATEIKFINVSRPKIKYKSWHYINASGNVLYSRYHGTHFSPEWRRGVSYVPASCIVFLPKYYAKIWETST